MDEKVKNALKYRIEILKQIKVFINNNPKINDIILAGDFNQDISVLEIQ